MQPVFRSNNRRFFLVAVVFLSLLGFVNCTKKGETGASAQADLEALLLGEFGTMTGPESTFGISTHRGIMMAVEEANAAGGIKGKPIKVISLDDQGRSDEAVTAVTKLVTQENVQLILGEVASSRSIAAAPVAQKYKVPMISPSSTNPRVTQVGDFIFRVCFIDPFQGKVMAKFAAQNLKMKTAAILRDIKSDYSVGLADFFAEDFQKMGGKIISDLSYSSGDADFKAQLTAIKLKKPDVLFIPGYYTEVGLIARQARELNYAGVLMGGDGWDSAKLTEIGGKAVVGGYFSSHYSPKSDKPVVQNFVSKYKEKYNGEVPNGLAAMGYDAARVAIAAALSSPTLAPTDLRDAVAKTKEFEGVTGVISLNDERNAVKPAVVLKVMASNDYEYVTTVNP
ncbi:MAG: ABC transporter substrate-binding protein [Bdellovibrionota bacterium]